VTSLPESLRAARPDRLSPREVAVEFRALVRGGARLSPAGEAREDPAQLLRQRWLPRHRVRLFAATFFLTDLRFDEDIRFLVGYVALPEPGRGERVRRIHPRIFYKDPSLSWRVASHVILDPEGNWIGKGDVRVGRADGERVIYSAEETCVLPFELQAAFDEVSRSGVVRKDLRAVPLLLRAAPEGRIEPYADFTEPRRRARRRGRIHGGRAIARCRERGDPRTLEFDPGYEPDLEGGLIDVSRSASKLYGGTVRKFRFLSVNGAVQHQIVLAPRHAWLNPPQALTSELSTYGVRTLDVEAPEELCVPGYEYHFVDEHRDPPRLHSQIPDGYAGAPSPLDPSRADASRWNEALPVIRRFRAWLASRARRSKSSSLPPAKPTSSQPAAPSPRLRAAAGRSGSARRP
jgi:hypothetical protein